MLVEINFFYFINYKQLLRSFFYQKFDTIHIHHMELSNPIQKSLRTSIPVQFDHTLDLQTYRLKSIGKQILSTGFEKHLKIENKSKTGFLQINQSKIEKIQQKQNNTIENYLTIIKKKTNYNRKILHTNSLLNNKFDESTNLAAKKPNEIKIFTFSSKKKNNPIRRRTTLEFLSKKITETIDMPKIRGILNNIISNYKCLESFGLPFSKINEIVINRCQDKQDLQYIFIKQRRNKLTEYQWQYRKSLEEIEFRLKSILSTKKEESFEFIINQVQQYNHLLSEDTLQKGKLKVIDVQKSIYKKQYEIAHEQKKLGYESIPPKNLNSNEFAVKISNIMKGIHQQEERNGLYKNISRINRKIYEVILEVQKQIISTNKYNNKQSSIDTFPQRTFFHPIY